MHRYSGQVKTLPPITLYKLKIFSFQVDFLITGSTGTIIRVWLKLQCRYINVKLQPSYLLC